MQDGEADCPDQHKPAMARWRGRQGPIDCPMCLIGSFQDVAWWAVAFVAAVIIVNYAYANLAPFHHVRWEQTPP